MPHEITHKLTLRDAEDIKAAVLAAAASTIFGGMFLSSAPAELARGVVDAFRAVDEATASAPAAERSAACAEVSAPGFVEQVVAATLRSLALQSPGAPK